MLQNRSVETWSPLPQERPNRGDAGHRHRKVAIGYICRLLLLAWLPASLPNAKVERVVLAQKDSKEPEARPVRNQVLPGQRLDCASILGAHANKGC